MDKGPIGWNRDEMAARAARELNDLPADAGRIMRRG